MSDEPATSRVPLRPTTYQELKDFRSGLDETFDSAILMLLRSVRRPGEDPFSAGRRLQAELERIQKPKN